VGKFEFGLFRSSGSGAIPLVITKLSGHWDDPRSMRAELDSLAKEGGGFEANDSRVCVSYLKK
jgi:hypothetical protein